VYLFEGDLGGPSQCELAENPSSAFEFCVGPRASILANYRLHAILTCEHPRRVHLGRPDRAGGILSRLTLLYQDNATQEMKWLGPRVAAIEICEQSNKLILIKHRPIAPGPSQTARPMPSHRPTRRLC